MLREKLHFNTFLQKPITFFKTTKMGEILWYNACTNVESIIKMKYYVVADIHSYYEPLKNALIEKGFFDDKEPHKLIVCGDLFDRGIEACAVQAFIADLLEKNQAVLIRGNHEDLTLDLLHSWDSHSYFFSHHISNGTVSTVLQLTGENETRLKLCPEQILKKMQDTVFMKNIIPAMVDYYETEHYIFVHGWIPCRLFKVNNNAFRYEAIENWRESSFDEWNISRWTNGMDAAYNGILDCKKTIVCGHWHCSFGHSRFEGKGSELGKDADFSPYYAKGIIAIDACTAISRKINCLVIDD